MNTQQVKQIEQVIQHHQYEDPEEQKIALAELITNIMHYCDEHQFNFWEVQEKSAEWWRKERR